jgi:hypothetical protein
VNLLEDNINILKGTTETLIDANRELGLRTDVEKTKYEYVLLSRHQNAGQNQDIKAANRWFEKKITVQILGEDSNKSKFDSGGNQKQFELW